MYIYSIIYDINEKNIKEEKQFYFNILFSFTILYKTKILYYI